LKTQRARLHPVRRYEPISPIPRRILKGQVVLVIAQKMRWKMGRFLFSKPFLELRAGVSVKRRPRLSIFKPKERHASHRYIEIHRNYLVDHSSLYPSSIRAASVPIRCDCVGHERDRKEP